MRNTITENPVMVNQMGSMLAEQHRVDGYSLPNTFGFKAVCHAALNTVQRGNHFPRLAVLTESPTWCRADVIIAILWSALPLRTPGTSTIDPSPDGSSIHDAPCHAQSSVHSMYKLKWDGLEPGPYSNCNGDRPSAHNCPIRKSS